jgi:C4-dicarboxylate transporter DctQ subunit
VNVLRRFDRGFDAVILMGRGISAYLIGFATVAVSVDVVMRYFFNRPMMWQSFVSENVLLFVLCLTAPYVLKKERHITMDFVIVRFKPRFRLMVDFATSILSTVALFPLVWYGLQKTMISYQEGLFRDSGAEWLKDYMVLWVIPFGMLLLLIQFLRRAYGRFKLWKECEK